MANFTVGASTQNSEDKEGVQKISHNRTLLAIQLTDRPDLEPKIVSKINSLSKVFAYYAPKKNILFNTLNETSIKDTLRFRSLYDFSPHGLKKSSVVLQTLYFQKTKYANAVSIIKRNSELQKNLLKLSSRKVLLAELITLKSQLDEKKKTTHPVSTDSNVLSFLYNEVVKLLNNNAQRLGKITPLAEASIQLALWEDLLSQNFTDIAALLDYANSRSEKASDCYRKNILYALQENKILEQSYRTVGLFFANTGSHHLSNVDFIDASMSQISDIDNTRISDQITTSLISGFDRLDLKDNYGLLLIPGFITQPIALDKYAKSAFKNKVFLCTDFRHLENPDDVVALFEERPFTGPELHKSNMLMTCNWLVGRGLYRHYYEENHLFIPPSAASAGSNFGRMNAVQGTCFNLKKGEISYLEKIGLIPMVYSSGTVYAQSSKTLFNGDNIGLQTYSVVRVFDYVTKALMDFLNRKTFESFDAKARKNLMGKIVRFMDDISGAGKLIENFAITRFEKDSKNRDKVHLEIHMTPYFPAKNFVLSMDGEQGKQSNTWEAHYAQLN